MKKTLNDIHVIGIKTRTINKGKQAGKDIKALLDRFFKEQVPNKIPNKVTEDIYCVYTNYKSDYLDWYDCYLCLNVTSLKDIPNELEGFTTYEVFESKGALPKVVLDTWEDIWSSSIKRAYITDFDVYKDILKNVDNTLVHTYVSV